MFQRVIDDVNHKLAEQAASGVPESMNFLRTGPRALFVGMAKTAACGLVRPDRLPASLWILVLYDGCVVIIRSFGIAVDGVSYMQLTELRDEGVWWLFFAAALIAYPRNTGYTK